jgi:hypothetical protein
MIYGAQNELVFGANEPKTNYKKTSKIRLLRTIGVKFAAPEALVGRPVEGGYISKEFGIAGIEIRPGQSLASGDVTGSPNVKKR